MKRIGTCKLTNKPGKFVEAHLLPKAVTKPSIPGAPFIQGGEGATPVRRWSSWYDRQLVTEEGEAILARLDDWGIKVLRQHRLIWNGWGPAVRIDEGTPIEKNWKLRKIDSLDLFSLRRFLFSLLWRAAASEREEFAGIVLPNTDLEILRRAIVDGEEPDVGFYPATLIQLSTLGPPHNQTPIDALKTIPSAKGTSGSEIKFFRFYFDGLIIHFNKMRDKPVNGSPLFVAAAETLQVPTVPYDESQQKDLLETIMNDSWEAAVRTRRTGLFLGPGN